MIDFGADNNLLRIYRVSSATWLHVIEHVTKHKKREAEVLGRKLCIKLHPETLIFSKQM
jgi:hypothetical protein